MAVPSYKCLECGNEIKLGEWTCFPGQQHRVASKLYRVPTGVADPADRAKSRLYVTVKPEKKIKDDLGNENTIPAQQICFVKGLYETEDPEEQYFFDTKYQDNLITAERWEQMYIIPEERIKMKERAFEANKANLLKEQSELLANVERLKKEAAELEAKKAKR